MKRKEIIVTVLICVLLIFGGTIGVSVCYHIVFHPERMVEVEPSENNDWKTKKHAYETKVLHPFQAWKEDGTITKLDGFKKYSDYYGNGENTYTQMKELVEIIGIDSKKLYDAWMSVYTFQEDTKEYEEYRLSYVLQVEMGESGEELIFVIDENNVPVSYQYYSQGYENSETSQMVISRTVVHRDLPWIFKQLDEVYEEKRYQDLTVFMGEAAGYGGEQKDGMSEHITHADWKLYTDDAMAAYVGTIGDYNFIFYYDRINNQFCGFNYGMNAKR